MQIFRRFDHPRLAPAVAVTIGNFDGVHRGHQAMLALLMQRARQRNLTTCVLSFEPHPREYFALQRGGGVQDVPARVATFRDKLQQLAACGVQQCVVLPFDAQLAAMPAAQFVQRVLVRGLGSRYVMVGDDFRFGAGRLGDIGLLQASAASLGFEVDSMSGYAIAGQRVSSSQVRAALAAGDLEGAHTLLGRPWSVSGHVVHGQQLGRRLGESRAGAADGFRTLNIRFTHPRPAASGVFVVQVRGLGSQCLPAVASLGVRPTLENFAYSKTKSPPVILEVHCLEWPAHWGTEYAYGKIVQVDFLHKLRDEEKFNNLADLTQAIARDSENARAFFANYHATRRQTTRDRI